MKKTSLGLIIEEFKDFFEPPVSKEQMRLDVVRDFKDKVLFNHPNKDTATISEEGGDIILKVTDPRIAAGYPVFESEDAYNQHLGLWMRLP